MHEGQRHEFREAARLRLQIPHGHEMPRPGQGMLDMAVHDRGRRAQTKAMRVPYDLEPLRRVHLVRADNGAHLGTGA